MSDAIEVLEDITGEDHDVEREAIQGESRKVSDLWNKRLILNREGNPKRALANIETVLRHHPDWQGVLRLNAFTGAVELIKPAPWGRFDGVAEWSELDDSRMVVWLERTLGPSWPAGQVRAAINLVAADHECHPIREWLAGLQWDGTPRLDSWLSTYLGASDQPAGYLANVGRWFMISAVARVERPGCQVDHMPVLEGDQGRGKSTACRELVGDDYFATISTAMGDKDSFMVLRQRWLVEVDELAGMRRAEIERVKSYVSARTDTYRPPYGRAVISVPRQCVLVGTTNSEAWMPDATGGRRFWPVRCGEIDLVGLRRDREQLWAEAYAHYQAGDPWWPAPEDRIQLADEVDERAQVDPWEGRIAHWLASRPETTMEALLGDCLGKSASEWHRADQIRVGGIMTRLKWRRKRPTINGQRVYVYYPPPEVTP